VASSAGRTWTVRQAHPGDKPQVMALLGAAFPGQQPDPTLWDWITAHGFDYYLVADAGDYLAGQYMLVPVRLNHKGSEGLGLLSVHTATHPDHRGEGIMTMLAQRLYALGDDQNAVVFGFPNSQSAPIFYRRLGWQRMRLPVWVRPVGPLLGRVGSAAVEEFDTFDTWADDMWRSCSSDARTTVVRDRAYLNWRFVDCPRTYVRLRVRRGHETTAFAVVTLASLRGARAVWVMEAMNQPGAESDLRTVIRAAIGRVKRRAVLVAALCAPRAPERSLLAGLGFAPVPQRLTAPLSFGVRGPAGTDDRPDLTLPSWRLTGADLDFV
jgi:GNAT superfamily N-acetyltransferase